MPACMLTSLMEVQLATTTVAFTLYTCSDIITLIIFAAAQTEVLSLQQLCIDCVASTLSSPKNVHFLPLPDNIKKKIAKVAFDPAIDMSFDPGNYSRHSSHDKVIDQADYKKLISKLR